MSLDGKFLVEFSNLWFHENLLHLKFIKRDCTRQNTKAFCSKDLAKVYLQSGKIKKRNIKSSQFKLQNFFFDILFATNFDFEIIRVLKHKLIAI